MPDATTATPPEPDNVPIPPRRPRLLLVDDQPINIQALYQIFHEDYEVFLATSGPEALKFCKSRLPDLILLDVMMPNMDGLEVCRHLQADETTASIPVIFVTAQNEPDDETRAFEAGGVDFISKPVNPTVVRARVKTHLTLKAQTDLLRSLVFIDGLTGVANRRRFDECLLAEWRHCQRSGSPLSLLMIDIDHFKLYNDYYGHQAGDACLQMVAATLQRSFGRPHDLVARYGGEEFVCLLPECGLSGATHRARTLCEGIAALRIPHESSPTAPVVTISVGVASLIPNADLTPEQLLAHADALLYAAKKNGRNRVSSAPLTSAQIVCPSCR